MSSISGVSGREMSLAEERLDADDAPRDDEVHGGQKLTRGEVTCLSTRISRCITRWLESGFFRWGMWMTQHPYLSILLPLVLCLSLSCGNLLFNFETDDEVLWTPFGSPFIEESKWVRKNFPKDKRYESLIIKSDNILTAENFRYFFKLRVGVENLVSDDGETFSDLCFRLPSIGRETSQCLAMGLFFRDEFTSLSPAQLESLTDEDLLGNVTEILKQESENPESSLKSVSEMISGLRMVEGRVVGATALLHIWVVNNTGSVSSLSWEDEFVELTVNSQPSFKPDNMQIFSLAEKSYDDELDYVVSTNTSLLLTGFGLLFVYVALVLGHFNLVEQRVFVSFAGILLIGMATGSAFGLCFLCGLSFNDMCPVIPFLLLGIGVDDMFVIVQCLDNLKSGEPVTDRVAAALKHAGLAITVTSFTDLAAFLIGSSTSMPILRTFCIFAGSGVFFLYIYAITFFVGCLVLDERRKQKRIEKNDFHPPPWTRRMISREVFKFLNTLIFNKLVSTIIILLALGFAAVGVYGLINIQSDYDSIWYMRQDSFQAQYYKELAQDFRGQGERVEIYLGSLDYPSEMERLTRISNYLDENEYVRNGSTQFWFKDFINGYDDTKEFYSALGPFLLQRYEYLADVMINVSTDNILDIYQGKFYITASRLRFQHVALDNTTVRNRAMDRVKEDMRDVVFQSSEFENPIVYSFFYIQWEANKVISQELVRNLSLAFLVIATVSLVLIAELKISVLVVVCVSLTLLDIIGAMYFLNLTIEIVTSINLLLSVGLALDYSAHIGVTFLVTQGINGRDRSGKVLIDIGPAVFNGGFSTFLAFVLVAFSDSYVFLTFFKMFALVVGFGLFHGLLVLPVVLAWILDILTCK